MHCIRGFIRSAGKCIQDERLYLSLSLMAFFLFFFVFLSLSIMMFCNFFFFLDLVQQVEMMKEKIRDFVCERKATLHCFQFVLFLLFSFPFPSLLTMYYLLLYSRNALISPFFLENFDQSYILETELKVSFSSFLFPLFPKQQ